MAGSFLLRLARALVARGAAIHVVAPSAPGYPAAETLDGVSIERVRYAPAALETIAYTGAMADALRSPGGLLALGGLLATTAAAVRRAARTHGADVVHAHWWFPGALAACAPGVLGGRPLVITSHGSDIRLAAKLAPARALFARVAARAAAYTAVSSWLCDEAMAMAPGLRCEVAPMPVETAGFAPPADDAGRGGLLFVGRLTAQKGVDVLLRALAAPALARETLTIVGDGPEGAALRTLAGSLGVAERVRWLGALPPTALPPHYAAARALVVPSREEGLGLVAVEGQLCATPVVAARSGGLPDVVRDDVTGVLVPPDDPAALAHALAALLADRPRAARLGARGRDAARVRFGPDAVADRYLQFYDRARGRKPRPGAVPSVGASA